MMNDKSLLNLVNKVKIYAMQENFTIATAESCTGGLLASYLTGVEGASNYFASGFITYSNESKINLLDVDPSIIEKFGAVSEETAIAMATGCSQKANSSISIAITGIAGPTGGTIEKPVGTVCFAILHNSNINSCKVEFKVERDKSPKKWTERQIICYLSCKKALEFILNLNFI